MKKKPSATTQEKNSMRAVPQELVFLQSFPYDNYMTLMRPALVLVGSLLLVFIWQNSEFSKYSIQAVGFLIFIYLLAASRNKWKVSVGGDVGIFVLNTIILLLIFQTGGLTSPLFFLLFFILFGIASVMDPRIVFVAVAGWMILFAPSLSEADTLQNIIRVGSLGLVSPLAYLFGKIFKKQENAQENISEMKERTKDAANTISSDIQEVLEKDKEKLESQEVEKLNEILEETQDLRDESKS
ncbi:MAG: hypothetical protein A3D82_03770 [Candidatus Levybacteria bacterium RIFCSPHIGHO2_02_FULL_40_29]|nr:MAG: hypothetical protein UU15_C0031G0003 [Candidatus Levybacteria bacterium GW2011_GWC2_40_7]KKR93338.1 MAG: hypothetical protein UU45_C0023G0002 [Candidatus Levybacteria bacterium GW2011_GWA2_41_15]OGH25144.1 MAG: hypothetical protein A3D82_03770 [Candidatus Levybacteria bacterium RIFCSPHIGHO2_02_FULL_40_29]OGH52630.1 MAG: hypothetical protein A2423_02465 [Candidatus Levybacteria bacterium RIFOXYC1_FULL_40_10]OGH52702.1 MAG: hypothetical protein A3H20_02155 [Candidatus Levybacteria bacteri